MWLHRNDIVFEGAAPSLAVVLSKICVEAELWRVVKLFKTSGSERVEVARVYSQIF
jgi:hypothetical protein